MGFRGALDWSPMMPREACLSNSCTPDRCIFSSLVVMLGSFMNAVRYIFVIDCDALYFIYAYIYSYDDVNACFCRSYTVVYLLQETTFSVHHCCDRSGSFTCVVEMCGFVITN